MADITADLLRRVTLSFTKQGKAIKDPETGRSFQATGAGSSIFRIFLDYRIVAYDFSSKTIRSSVSGTTVKGLRAFNISPAEFKTLSDQASLFMLKRFREVANKRPKDLTLYEDERIIVAHSSKESSNFNLIQSVLTTIKRDAMREVASAVNQIKKGVNLTRGLSNKKFQRAVFLGVVIAGFNIPDKDFKKPTTNFNILGEQEGREFGTIKTKTLNIVNFQDKTIGVDIGHASGAAVSAAIDAIKAAEALGLDTSSLQKYVDDIKKIDINAEILKDVETRLGKTGKVKFEGVITGVEQLGKNRSEGSRAGRKFLDFLDALSELLENNFIEELEKNDLPFRRQSPSLIDDISSFYENLFLETSFASKANPKSKLRIEIKDRKTVQLLRSKANKTLNIKADREDSGLNLEGLVSVVNAKLHDYLKKNMGKGNAPKALNYRTGRFAKSAELKDLQPTRGKAIEATITYLRNPYDAFLPGGRLHNELRDPQKLIGKSVRQILADEVKQRLSVRTRLV